MVGRTINPRRRLSTPSLRLSPAQMSVLQAVDPASPPDTPTVSPLLPRKKTQSAFFLDPNSFSRDPNIRPYGKGHQFSYRPLEQLSPRSSSSSEAQEHSSDDDDDSEGASIVSLPNSPPRPQHSPAGGEASQPDESAAGADADADADAESESDSESDPGSDSDSESDAGSEADSEADFDGPAREASIHASAIASADLCDFTIEDVDPMDSECEGLDVLFPTEVESNRSQSRSRHKDLDKGMMHDLKNLNCSNEASDNEAEQEAELGLDEIAFLRRQQELKRIRRVSMSSSFGKRTHSELSDSDDNDVALDVNEVGSSARRFRKRLHRGSLLFQDPPAPRIDELEEPNSSEDEYANEMRLAQELPYHTMEYMETESN